MNFEEFSAEEFENYLHTFFGEKEAPGYVLKKEEGPIKVHINENGEDIKGMKTWAKVESTVPVSVEELSNIYLNPEISYKESPQFSKFKVIRKEENENTDVIFAVIKIPIPMMANRYSITRRRWKFSEDKNSFVFVQKTLEDTGFEKDLEGNLKKKEVKMYGLIAKKYERIIGEESCSRVVSYGCNNIGGNLVKMSKLTSPEKMMLKMAKKERESVVKINETLKKEQQQKKE